MKFPSFQYRRPAALADAMALLQENDQSTPIAGGQSLLAMMGFRLAQPEQLIDISALQELRAIENSDEAVAIGAAIRHAELEDGAVDGPLGAFLARAARNIGYRAIRNRGTVGGSLAHADPAADWPVVLNALEAQVEIANAAGCRRLSVADFILGEMSTALMPGELIAKIIIKRAQGVGYGVHKVARKQGEFANAIAAAVSENESSLVSVGIVAGLPLTFRLALDAATIDLSARLTGTPSYRAIQDEIAAGAPDADGYEGHLAAIAACHALRAAWDDRTARS